MQPQQRAGPSKQIEDPARKPLGPHLERAIHAYIERTNTEPKPFVWTKSADDILASVKRFC